MTQQSAVQQYDPNWVKTFEHIKGQVWPKIKDIALSIEHVGSTSIPNLFAKPVIDIDVIVANKE